MEIQPRDFKTSTGDVKRTNHSRIESTGNCGLIITAEKDDLFQPQGPKLTSNLQIGKTRVWKTRFVCGSECRESPKYYKNKATDKATCQPPQRKSPGFDGGLLLVRGPPPQISETPPQMTGCAPQMTSCNLTGMWKHAHMECWVIYIYCAWGSLRAEQTCHTDRNCSVKPRSCFFLSQREDHDEFRFLPQVGQSVSVSTWVDWTLPPPCGLAWRCRPCQSAWQQHAGASSG